MKEKNSIKYTIQLGFEEIRLPPFEDILILGKRSPQGKIGVFHSMNMLIPNEFEIFEIDKEENIEAIVINKRILKKIDSEKVLKILKERVFPYISDSEIVKVDLKVKFFYDLFEQEL